MQQQESKKSRKESGSFILHENIIRMSAKLSDAELARLFRHIYRHVNDPQTTFEDESVAVDIIYTEWERQYTADKEEYERVCQKRREAGNKGNQKRWGKPSSESSLSSASSKPETTETIAKGNESVAKIANATNAIAKIADNDNEYDNDYDINIKETSPKGEAKKKVSLALSRPIDIRKKEFYESILPYTDRYERDMLNDFYQYWTEMDRRRQRMRFEMQKTWETGKRLAVWARKPFQVDKWTSRQGDKWTSGQVDEGRVYKGRVDE